MTVKSRMFAYTIDLTLPAINSWQNSSLANLYVLWWRTVERIHKCILSSPTKIASTSFWKFWLWCISLSGATIRCSFQGVPGTRITVKRMDLKPAKAGAGYMEQFMRDSPSWALSTAVVCLSCSWLASALGFWILLIAFQKSLCEHNSYWPHSLFLMPPPEFWMKLDTQPRSHSISV